MRPLYFHESVATPNCQLPSPNHYQSQPSSSTISKLLGIGNWEWLAVGSRALGVDASPLLPLADLREDAPADFFGHRTLEEEVVAHRRLRELADALELAAQARRIHDRRGIGDGDGVLHLVAERSELLILRPPGADTNHQIAVAALRGQEGQLHCIVPRRDVRPHIENDVGLREAIHKAFEGRRTFHPVLEQGNELIVGRTDVSRPGVGALTVEGGDFSGWHDLRPGQGARSRYARDRQHEPQRHTSIHDPLHNLFLTGRSRHKVVVRTEGAECGASGPRWETQRNVVAYFPSSVLETSACRRVI